MNLSCAFLTHIAIQPIRSAATGDCPRSMRLSTALRQRQFTEDYEPERPARLRHPVTWRHYVMLNCSSNVWTTSHSRSRFAPNDSSAKPLTLFTHAKFLQATRC